MHRFLVQLMRKQRKEVGEVLSFLMTSCLHQDKRKCTPITSFARSPLHSLCKILPVHLTLFHRVCSTHRRLFSHLFILISWYKMMRNSTTLRRLLTSKIHHAQTVRVLSYHNSSVVLADALDMTDTFARRHSKFRYFSSNSNDCLLWK
jgi:hypothetical protein